MITQSESRPILTVLVSTFMARSRAALLLTSVLSDCPHGYKANPNASNKKQSTSGSKRILDDFLNERDQAIIRSTWNTAKNGGHIGPKTFLRYFELKPEAQKMFPAFANVEHARLPTNDEFIAQAETCVSSLNAYIEHLGKNPRRCPFIAKAKGRYHHEDLKLLGVTLMGVLEEELGEQFTDESKESWKRGLHLMSVAVSKKTQKTT